MRPDVILARYGEIGLKSPPVRRRFEQILQSNIEQAFEQEGLDCIVRRLRSSSEAGEAGVMATESVMACISVPPEVHCCAIARVKTSIEVVIDVVESRPPCLVVPVISTDCERCIRRVSPMCGRIWRRTGWARAA